MKNTSRVLALSLYLPNCDKKGFFKRKQVSSALQHFYNMLSYRKVFFAINILAEGKISLHFFVRAFHSVNHPGGVDGASAGVWIRMEFKCQGLTTVEVTSSAKISRTTEATSETICSCMTGP